MPEGSADLSVCGAVAHAKQQPRVLGIAAEHTAASGGRSLVGGGGGAGGMMQRWAARTAMAALKSRRLQDFVNRYPLLVVAFLPACRDVLSLSVELLSAADLVTDVSILLKM